MDAEMLCHHASGQYHKGLNAIFATVLEFIEVLYIDRSDALN